MGDGPRGIEIIPDYFQTSGSTADSPHERSDTSMSGPDSPHTSTSGANSHLHEDLCASHPSADNSPRTSQSYSSTRKKLRSASSMLKSLRLRGLRFTGANGEEKVELSAVELETLRSELANLEEREAYLKAQLEHVDIILQQARLSGYLFIRTRWAALPGEMPPIDDCDVDDWIPRFVVLQGQCIFFYQSSTDLSPQDTTLLSDIIEVGPLPNLVRDNEEIWYSFYIVTRFGLRMECSSMSRMQAETWLTALQTDCRLGPDKTDPVDHNCKSNSQNCTV